jgi:uncharacterized lipoprotein YehR (DUF1307 family)
MRRILILVAVVVALTLTGCAELFTYNAFDGIGAPDFPDSPEEVTGILDQAEGTQGKLAAVTDLMSSNAFYDSLDELGEEDKNAVVKKMTDELTLIFTNEDETQVTKEERAEAAILTAELYLNTNDDAKKVVDEMLSPVFDALSDPEASPEEVFAEMDVETVLTDVLTDAFGGADNLESALDALAGAADAYTFFGLTLPPLDGEAEYASVRAVTMEIEFDEFGIPDNISEVVQNALVAIGVTTFNFYYEQYTGETLADVEEILFVVDNTDMPIDENDPDGPTYGDIVIDTIEDLMTNEAFMRILAAAGLDEFFTEDDTDV